MQQFQNTITVNPQSRVEVLRQAQLRHVTLNPAEKKEMLERANKLKKAGSKAFNNMLKENKITPADFDNEVLEIGLASKTAKLMIQDTLLAQLTNRQLLAGAAKANGFTKQALNKFNEEKQTPQYQQLLRTSGLPPEVIEQEMIKNSLCAMMIDKLQSEAKVSNDDLRAFYDKNKAVMKHGARIKLSQILIQAPSQDKATVESLTTQMRKAHPKMSEKEVEKEVDSVFAKQRQKAESLLTRARSNGVDFAELANQNTEDTPARTAKNGGDLSYQEESRLPKEFLVKVNPLKVGEVSPILIQSPMGFHIIKLTDRQPAGIASYDEAKDRIEAFLREGKSKDAVQKWLENERRNAKVVMSPEVQAIIATIGAENKQKNIRTP
jgi:parvulin-like peptidyl-prolyl isomerase